MSILDIAQQRKGKLRDGYSTNKAGASEAKTRVEYGTAQGDSSGGFVEIMIDNSDESFEVACDSPISNGDRVAYISTNGNGKAVSVATLADMAEEVATIVRELPAGVLVAKVGQSLGALVNANGSFDVVSLTWSGDTPTIGNAIATFGGTVEIKTPDGNGDYGLFQIDDVPTVTIKKSVNGQFIPSGIVLDTATPAIYVNDTYGRSTFSIDTNEATYNHKAILATPYKAVNDTYIIPSLWVSTYYTTDSDPTEPGNFEALPIFKIATYTHTSQSIAVGNGASISAQSLANAVPTGYKAVAVASVNSNHAQNWYVGGSYINVANQTIAFSYKHAFGSGSEKCTFTFYLLCVPSANVG